MKDLFELEAKLYWPVFNRLPLVIERGEGVFLYDREGNRFLDFLTGIGVAVLGHAHPVVINAVRTQAEKLLSCSNVFYTEPQLKLAELLQSQLKLAGKWFFSNSGAEANEAALKLVRRYGVRNGKREIVALNQSFHGRTFATMSATCQEKMRKDYGALLDGFRCIEPEDFAQADEVIGENTAAVMLELVQGESGVRIISLEYVRFIADKCRQVGALLVIDEVQTGLGRTGSFYAFEQYSVEPDIFTLAKGLANGIPCGATWANDQLLKLLDRGDHGSTYGGNAFVCGVAADVVRTIIEMDYPELNRRKGQYFKSELSSRLAGYPVREIRQAGLMIAVEFEQDVAARIVELALKNGLICGKARENTIRFLPPYTAESEHFEFAAQVIEKACREVF